MTWQTRRANVRTMSAEAFCSSTASSSGPGVRPRDEPWRARMPGTHDSLEKLESSVTVVSDGGAGDVEHRTCGRPRPKLRKMPGTAALPSSTGPRLYVTTRAPAALSPSPSGDSMLATGTFLRADGPNCG